MKERAVKWLSDAPVGSHAESDHSDDASNHCAHFYCYRI